MGKSGSWFSAIKRVFTPTSKDKPSDDSEKRSRKEKKKKGLGKLKHGDSFIPHFRQPSSIEKILGEAERDHNLIDFRGPIGSYDQPRTPTFVPSIPLHNTSSTSPWTPTPQRISSSPKGSMSRRLAATPMSFTPQREVSPPRSFVATPSNASASPWSGGSRYVHRPRPETTLRYQHVCATRIQAAFRGYMTRRSCRALRGLVRLQGVVKGESVKRQTLNAMKCMQLLVRVQTQIQSRRIQMLENQTLQCQASHKNERDMEGTAANWSLGQMFEDDNSDRWDDSLLTKEEVEASTQRKFEAMMKRERAMAYAYSRQTWKPSTAPLMDIRASGGFPWWWNWLDRRANPSTNPTKPSQATKSLNSTPARPSMTSPRPALLSQQNLNSDTNLIDTTTPRSARSAVVPPRMHLSPTPHSRKHNTRVPRETHSPFKARFKDDDSLTSCPAFSAKRYMEPTLSAKAKAREGVSPEVEAKRRVSFPFKWSRRGSATNTPTRESGSTHRVLEKKQSMQSIGNVSVDSTVSMPAAMGRKPFNRFV